MKIKFHKWMALVVVVALAVTVSFATQPATDSYHPASKSSKSHHGSKKSHKKRPHGQQAIDTERCRKIQEALVSEHYMTSQPTGKWDDATQQAMRRYQADQGWQNKTVPDSRALIRLGLGPDHEHLLNPESAMTSEPQLPHGTSVRAKAAASSSRSASPAQSSPTSSLPGQSSPATPVGTGTPDVSPQR